MTDRIHTPERAAELLAKGLRGCVACRKDLPLDDFHVDKQAKSGRQSRCKPCRREYRMKINDRKEYARGVEFNDLSLKEWQSLSPEELGIDPEVWHGVYLRKMDEATVRRLCKGGGQKRRDVAERFLKQSDQWS